MKKYTGGLSLVELVIAMAIMVIIMAAIMPQFHAIQNSWASSEASANMIQNGRVLEEHINRNLAAAKQIVSVSPGSTTNGFIIFKDVAGIQQRYMVSGGYVVFGALGSEAQLAGPVSRFKVSCYSLNDVNTPITDANNIRLVKVETDFTNSNPLGTNRTFITSAYLQTNANAGCSLVGWWKLDETSGTAAADSSGNGNTGTLQGAPLPTWSPGQFGNCLSFASAGGEIYVPSSSTIDFANQDFSVSLWAIQPTSFTGQYELLIKGTIGSGLFPGTGKRYELYRKHDASYDEFRFAIDDDVTKSEITVAPSAFCTGNWVHIAAVRDTAAHQIRLYADGVLQDTVTDSTGNISQNEPLYIADGVFTNGSIDDVRIYNRVLTAAEIAQLTNTLKYMGFNEAKAASDLTSLAVPIPTGTSSGDLLIAAVATDEDTSTTITTAAAGWTQIDRGASGGAVTLGAWYKVAGASESAPTFTWAAGNPQQAYGWMMRFTGQNTTNPINGTPVATSTTSATPTSPAVITTVDNCIILRLGAFNNDDIIIDNPALLSGNTTITADESAAATTPAIPTFIAAGVVTSSIGTIIPALPAGIAADDILLLFLETSNQAISITNANGGIWTAVTNSPQSTGIAAGATGARLTAFWSRYNGIQGAPTTSDSGDHQMGRIVAIRGAIASGNPWDVTAGGVEAVADTSGSIAGATTTVANTLVVTAISTALPDLDGTTNFSVWTNANLTSLTERTDNTTSQGNGGGLGIATGGKATIGAYGNTAVTCTASYKAMMSIAIKPPAAFTGTVCGGAGYVKQPTAGSSGTSNFTLGSSNEARTITIAIAPNSTTNDGCSGGIRP